MKMLAHRRALDVADNRSILALVVAVSIGAALFPRGGAAPPVGILVITLDTTRADRLSAYGFMSASQPRLDRLASEGVVFDQAISVAPLTLPAHTSLFTGLLPPRHGIHDNDGPPARADLVMLAELLRARGFRTGAFTGSIVLDADRGLVQGFERYTAPQNLPGHDGASLRAFQRRAHAVVDDAIEWLDGVNGSRFFLWTHLYDAHRPYDPPEPYRSQYADPYLGEISYADSQIARLLDALERRGLLARTVVVVAGDHGESLGDHGERDHGIFVYDSVLRVPLIVTGPGIRPARVASPVRLVDVMPTVLDLLGQPIPPMDGSSLVDLMRGTRRDVALDVYAESFYPLRLGWAPLRTLRDGRFKLIDAPRPELYDLTRDPFELRNVIDEYPTVTAALQAALKRFDASPAVPAAVSAIDPDVQERVAALGYVAMTRHPAASADRERLPDPKDGIEAFNRRRPGF